MCCCICQFCGIDVKIVFEQGLLEVLIGSFAIELKIHTFHEMPKAD